MDGPHPWFAVRALTGAAGKRSQPVQAGTSSLIASMGERTMRLLIGAMAVTISLILAVAALAQSTTAPTPAPAAGAPVPANTAAAAEPVPSGKRFACQTAAQGFKGQERQDQMQLCMAQARIDCLKQAIDQKIVGPQRRDFVKSCAE
jgi:hypothetical protein